MLKKIENNSPHIQHFNFITEIGIINLVNIYITHDNLIKKSTIQALNKITNDIRNKFIIIGGDLNSYNNSKLDYYSNYNSKINFTPKYNTFKSITTPNIIDTFRYLHPNQKKFTKWTLNSFLNIFS